MKVCRRGMVVVMNTSGAVLLPGLRRSAATQQMVLRERFHKRGPRTGNHAHDTSRAEGSSSAFKLAAICHDGIRPAAQQGSAEYSECSHHVPEELAVEERPEGGFTV